MLARAGRVVELAWRNVVAHAVDLIVGEPQVAGPRVEVLADRVADAARKDLAVLAVAIHANDAADPPFAVLIRLLGRRAR